MLFIPPSGLLTVAGDDKAAQTFVLASNEWFDLQTRLQTVLALPYTFQEYENRYGTASSGSLMKECFAAMSKLQNVAQRYGSPAQLRAKILKDPNFLATFDLPQNDAYAATVWTLERAHQDAFSLASTLKSIPSTARGEPAGDVVSGIKSLFFDNDQICDRMQRTVDRLDALLRQYRAISDELAEAQDAMRVYTNSSSQTRQALDTEIGGLQAKIAQLEKDRDNAYRQWLSLTISACMVPAGIVIIGVAVMVLLSVPTGGGSFAVGSIITGALAGVAGTALGIAATNARTAYEDLVKQVSSTNDFMQKRVAYRHDLGALDTAMTFSLPSANKIIEQVGVIRDSWASSLQEIKYKVGELDVNNLASGPWLQDAEMAASAANWTKIDQAMRAFTGGAFVDVDSKAAFGNAMPKDDPNWQNNLKRNFKIAA